MIDTLERLSDAARAGAFVVIFTDGRLLLASTTPETRVQICATKPLDERSH